MVWSYVITVGLYHAVALLAFHRNYETGEQSRNNWFVALISNGEGWHNNHPFDPRSARHGHRRWEIDIVYASIVVFEAVGLARNVRRPDPRHLLTADDTRG